MTSTSAGALAQVSPHLLGSALGRPQLLSARVQGLTRLQAANQQRDSNAAHGIIQVLSEELTSAINAKSSRGGIAVEVKDLLKLMLMLRDLSAYHSRTTSLLYLWQRVEEAFECSNADRIDAFERNLMHLVIAAARSSCDGSRNTAQLLADAVLGTPLSSKALHIELICSVCMFIVQGAVACVNPSGLQEVERVLIFLGDQLQARAQAQLDVRKELDIIAKTVYNSIMSVSTGDRQLSHMAYAVLMPAIARSHFAQSCCRVITAAARKLGTIWKDDCSLVPAPILRAMVSLVTCPALSAELPEHVELVDTMVALAALFAAKAPETLRADLSALLVALASFSQTHSSHTKVLAIYAQLLVSAAASADLCSCAASWSHFAREATKRSLSTVCLKIAQAISSRLTSVKEVEVKRQFLQACVSDLTALLMGPPGAKASSKDGRKPDEFAGSELLIRFLASVHGCVATEEVPLDALRKATKDAARAASKGSGGPSESECVMVAVFGAALELVLCPLDASSFVAVVGHVAALPASNALGKTLAMAFLLQEWASLAQLLHLRGQAVMPLVELPIAALDIDPTVASFASWARTWACGVDLLDTTAAASHTSASDPICSFFTSCSDALHCPTAELGEMKAMRELHAAASAHGSLLLRAGVEARALQALIDIYYAKHLFFSCQPGGASILAKSALGSLQIGGCKTLRLEALILIVDIYDFVGKLPRALDYMAEIESLCQSAGEAGKHLRSLAALHTARVLLRSQSRQSMATLLPTLAPLGSLRRYRPECFEAALCIAKHVLSCGVVVDKDLEMAVAKAEALGQPRHSTARSLHRLWGIGQGTTMVYRHLTATQANFQSRVQTQSLLSFDALRNTRRALAWESQPERKPLGFILAASSLSPAIEVQMMAEMRTLEEGEQPNRLTCHCELVHRAAMGEAKACADVLSKIESLPAGSTLLLMCLDRTSKGILLGKADQDGWRLDRVGEAVWAEVTATLEDFKGALAANDESLGQTRNIEKAKALSAAEKKAWWAERERVDANISGLCDRLNAALAKPIAGLLRSGTAASSTSSPCTSSGTETCDDCNEIDRLIAQSEVLCVESDVEDEGTLSYEEMKLVELRALAKERGLSTVGRKAELVSRLQESDIQSGPKVSRSVASSVMPPQTKRPVTQGTGVRILEPVHEPSPEPATRLSGHVILMLDEAIQAFPVESLPLLRDSSCSRVPSLPLLLSLLSAVEPQPAPKTAKRGHSLKKAPLGASAVDIERCWYALDVDQNLPETRQTMQQFLQPFAERFGWKGVVGSVPDQDLVRELNAWGDWYIYCGHGAGDKVFSALDEAYHHRAALLWGCSSGRLVTHGVFDPFGSALTHLQAGCSLVAGNLWDVTDRDLDKLSMACMATATKHITTQTTVDPHFCITFPRAIQTARDVCKMKHAVASAAVVYGLPMTVA